MMLDIRSTKISLDFEGSNIDLSKREKGTKFFDEQLYLQLRNFDRENVILIYF